MSSGLPPLNFELLGESNSFVQAMGQARGAIQAVEQKVAGVGSALASQFKKIVAPVGLAIAGALASKKALDAFAGSKLPGAAEFTKTLDKAKESLQNLSAAVGEFLAPAAARAAKITASIADALTPVVRRFTAFFQSAAEWLKQLGANFVSAFSKLVPTAAAAFDRVMDLFTGMMGGGDIFATLADAWQTAWENVIRFTSPILVQLGDLIETSLVAAIEIGTIAIDGLVAAFGMAGDAIAAAFPAGGAALPTIQEITDAIQNGLVKALAAAEFAVKNWRDAAEVAWTAVQLGFETTKNQVLHAWDELPANFEVIARNIGAIFDSVIDYIAGAFSALATTIETNMSKAVLNATRQIPFVGGGDRQAMNWDVVNKPFKQPELEALPGFGPREIPEAEKKLRDMFGKLSKEFGADFAKFFGDKLGGLGDRAGKFMHDLLKGLPGFNLKPGAPVEPPKPVVPPPQFGNPYSRAAFAEVGTQQGYQQALRALGAVNGDVFMQQLNELKQVNTNTRQLAQKPEPDRVRI